MSLGTEGKLKKSPKISSVTVTDDGKIKLKWSKVETAEKYAVKRSESSKGEFELITWVTKPEFTDTVPQRDKTYWYKITAWKKLEGKKTSSKNSAVRAAVITDIPAPTGVSVKALKKPAVELKWENAKGCNGCIISRRNDFFSQIIPVAKVKGTSYIDETVVSGQAYHYSLQSFMEDGESIRQGLFSPEEDCIHLDCGAILSAKTYPGKRIAFSLRIVAGADGYILFRSEKKDGDYLEVARSSSGLDFRLEDKVARPLKTYFYKTAAFRKIGDREFLSEMTKEIAVKSKI